MSDQMDTGITSDDKLWALLAYLLTPLIPVVILLMEDKKNRPFIRAHNAQALAWGIVVWVLGWLLAAVTFGIAGIAIAVITIIWAIKAYQGEYVNIPVITDFVKKQGWA
ncbi:MAG: DUF4870 domain-containing protein [Anaerolineae bacterium]|nr:DUF4870 domain-containing protein [Anaerolineae bacterium]